MKFFIPTIGTKVTLTQPWAFTLYSERRNSSLMSAVGLTDKDCYPKAERYECGSQGGVWNLGRTEEHGQCFVSIRRPGSFEIRVEDHPLVGRFERIGPTIAVAPFAAPEGSLCAVQIVPGPRRREITIPAGATLTVDRIYIRQNAEDFDSISFVLDMVTAKQMGAKTGSYFGRAGARFWAKLGDVHSMEFDLHE
jgi:hypothetical protein